MSVVRLVCLHMYIFFYYVSEKDFLGLDLTNEFGKPDAIYILTLVQVAEG